VFAPRRDTFVRESTFDHALAPQRRRAGTPGKDYLWHRLLGEGFFDNIPTLTAQQGGIRARRSTRRARAKSRPTAPPGRS